MEENRFEYFYRRYQNIRKIYSNGEVELARSEFDSFIAEISREGSAFFDLFEEYKIARKNGNKWLHLKGTAKKAEEQVKRMKESGIEDFTFRGPMESCMRYQNAGCVAKGFVMVRGEEDPFEEGGREVFAALHFHIE
nr:MAG TPA: hypothetical protein [Caudoviricetes sp.]